MNWYHNFNELRLYPYLAHKMQKEFQILNITGEVETLDYPKDIVTHGCEEVIQHRVAYQPKWDYWQTGRLNKGVTLDMEIRSSLFLANDINGAEIFIAVAAPASTRVASNGVLKNEILQNT